MISGTVCEVCKRSSLNEVIHQGSTQYHVIVHQTMDKKKFTLCECTRQSRQKRCTLMSKNEWDTGRERKRWYDCCAIEEMYYSICLKYISYTALLIKSRQDDWLAKYFLGSTHPYIYRQLQIQLSIFVNRLQEIQGKSNKTQPICYQFRILQISILLLSFDRYCFQYETPWSFLSFLSNDEIISLLILF